MKDHRTNWWQIILVLLIGAGAIDGFMWYLYNTYVPLYLQGGNPNFQADVVGFGLTPKVVGLILVLDNIVALILAPIIGAWSDGYRGRYGRRMPFVLATVPLAAIATAIIPFIVRRLPAELSGNLPLLMSLFIPFLVTLFFIIVPLAVARTPIDALVYDLAPSEDRSKARSLGIILATLLSIGLGIGGSILYGMNIILPYLMALLVTAILLGLGVWLIKERRGSQIAAEEGIQDTQAPAGLRHTLAILRGFPSDNKRSILLLAVNIFCGMFGFSLIQAFLSSYNMTSLGASEAQAGIPFLVAGGTVLVMSFPAALLGNKIGRKRTMIIGCAGWAVTVMLFFLFSSPVTFIPALILTGAFYALWFVNSFVAIVDAAPDDSAIGTMVSLQVVANTAGMSVGPFLAGLLIEAAGYNYALIFPLQAVMVVIAILVLIPVNKGEVRQKSDSAAS